MFLSKAAAAVSFFGAVAIGTAAAYVAAGEPKSAADPRVTVSYTLDPVPAFEPIEAIDVSAEDLEGVWKGTWDHSGAPCTIVIRRIEGNKFYGTLAERGAEVSFEGTFHADERRVFFRETKVIKLGAFGEWSLGTNSGSFSLDGRTLSGTGVDRWGTYNWNVTKE